MRITNVAVAARAFPYADKHGRTLGPGETSPELPLVTAQHRLFQSDLKLQLIKVTLSSEDKAHIAQLLTADAAPVAMPAKPARKSAATQARDQIRARAAEAKATAAASPVRVNPGGSTGQPSWSPDLPHIDVKPGEAKSLAQLMQANRSKGKVPTLTSPLGGHV